MPPKVRVLSVPHSGTRFLMGVLKRARVPYVFEHFRFATEGYASDLPTILAYRDRAEVEASWRRRGKWESERHFESLWGELTDYMNNNDYTLFRVADEAHREGDLRAVSELVGVELSADFSRKVGAS